MEAVEALHGLAAVPLILAVASLRNWNGWVFELGAGPASLRGTRIRGLLVLAAGLMFGGGSALEPGRGGGRWPLLALSAALALAFALYRPRAVGRPVDGRHSKARFALERRSRRTWLLTFTASALLAGAACLPWW